jgi:hydroxymethylglutaryl-CoA reductase
MRIVVNHLTFAEPIPTAVIESARDAAQAVVEAGGLDASLVKVDETRAILVLTFPDSETEERIKSEVGGPWMREHITPLLAEATQRASGEVVAGPD